MDGILFAAVLITVITAAGLRSRKPGGPGALLTLALAAGSVWYVLA